MAELSALVVGGGIAGLASAIALGQAGAHCDVIELSDRPIGTSISFSGGSPMRSLAALGVLDDCLATGTPMTQTQLRFFDGAGHETLALGPPGEGPPRGVGIHRPVLAEILAAAARAQGASVVVGGARLVDLDATGSARFDDDTERRYDLVIGADGINSTVRRLVFPDAAEPTLAGQGSLRWMAPGAPPEGPGSFYRAGPVQLASYGLPQGTTYVAVNFDDGGERHVAGPEAVALLREQLDVFTAPYVVALKERLRDDQEVLYRAYRWVLVDEPWVRGRVVLVGDAAHATTAHMASGGVMALEDAVVLGQELADLDIEAALGAYAARRFDRAAMVVRASVRVAEMEQQGCSPMEIAQVRVPAIMELEKPY